ncbi:MAG: HAD-IIB family hydrolase [Methylococcaceae bacterium]|nr:HAD-IIB family hydrolase [Methylococcaceae bacterium]
MKNNKQKRYLLLISVHGLIRGKDQELGRDADSGGQIKYVLDLARSLAKCEDVEKVDLVTRRIVDSSVSSEYALPIEELSPKTRIVRINAGPEEYIAKEQLWDYLDSMKDNLVNWLNDQPRMPDVIHTHYADAGYVGVRLANQLGVPLIHTGHSLGRDKRKQLLAKGLSREEIETTYNIERRIDAEEEVLANADLVITSTRNEIEEQYELYNYYDPSRMQVIPPGTNLQQFFPPIADEKIAFVEQLKPFLSEPEKPLILALSRPDERKNFYTLVEVFGESELLQQHANLLIIAGNRDDIRDLDPGAQSVLTNILLLIDSYNLYGKVAVPKHHRPDEVSGIYRLVSASQGVFINPALTEPFGLTILEAAASGLPVVATENGGPVDIIANCHNGELVDPLDKTAITEALLKLLQGTDAWLQASKNGIEGVRRHYTWESHAEAYMEKVKEIQDTYSPPLGVKPAPRAIRYRDRAIFTVLDENLLGNQESLDRFSELIRKNHKSVTFGIATGRRMDSALAIMKKYKIPVPDVLVSSLGTRIHYGKALTEDAYWVEHIDHDWNPHHVLRALEGLPGLKLQPKKELSHFKISYYYDSKNAPSIDEIIALIRKKELTTNVFFTNGELIDIVPSRASKGQALRYVAQRLDIPLEHILAAGGSGADEDMMRGNTLAVVVGNRHQENLSDLEDHKRIYFANQAHAGGILEAIEYYDFFNTCKVPEGQ